MRKFRLLLPKSFWHLSVTMRSSRPYKIFINSNNWSRLPSKSDYNSIPSGLESYRTALLSHEFAHALGHDHVGCRGQGYLSDVRQQPSLPLDGCRPTKKVIFSAKSPHRPDII